MYGMWLGSRLGFTNIFTIRPRASFTSTGSGNSAPVSSRVCVPEVVYLKKFTLQHWIFLHWTTGGTGPFTASGLSSNRAHFPLAQTFPINCGGFRGLIELIPFLCKHFVGFQFMELQNFFAKTRDEAWPRRRHEAYGKISLRTGIPQYRARTLNPGHHRVNAWGSEIYNCLITFYSFFRSLNWVGRGSRFRFPAQTRRFNIRRWRPADFHADALYVTDVHRPPHTFDWFNFSIHQKCTKLVSNLQFFLFVHQHVVV